MADKATDEAGEVTETTDAPAPADNPTLNDLLALAAVLPPSEKPSAQTAADLTGALAAVVTYGTGIVDASKQGGGPAVADYIHQHMTDKAAAAGTEPPQRGNVTTVAAAAPVAPGAPATIDYDQLAAAIVKAQGNATEENK